MDKWTVGRISQLTTEPGMLTACNCIGPQQGFPKCPCMMRGLIQRDGRWVEPEKDLGPVRSVLPDLSPKEAD